MSAPPHIAVVGAGAFGGWTALHLLRCGARVTLLDAWGPGNARSSSGGETRIMRGTYGAQGTYTRLAARALSLWHEHERRWQLRFFKPIGVLWLAGQDDAFERAALPALRDAGLPADELSRADLARRWPQINAEDVRWALLERDGGYVAARLTCDVVLDGFREEGGEYRELAVRPGAMSRGALRRIELSDGSRLEADAFVFACGPWLGTLFPDVLGPLVRVTRQEVFFLGTPSGDARFSEDALPVWADRRARARDGTVGPGAPSLDLHRHQLNLTWFQELRLAGRQGRLILGAGTVYNRDRFRNDRMAASPSGLE